MSAWLQKQWMRYTVWHILLVPVSWLFFLISFLRRTLYKLGFLNTQQLPVPVIVVGNINVGGTGKTPLVIWLVQQLKSTGYQPGIISRGYGGNTNQVREVFAHDLPAEAGDEPVLIAKRTNSPVFVHANRVAAGKALLVAHPECNIIISDDGLQHYRLHRDVEIVVVDGVKGFGNQALLPAGPLREPVSRLQQVDALVINGMQSFESDSFPDARFEMQLESGAFYNLLNPAQKCDASALQKKQVAAVAGIGNPARFFHQLQQLGVHFQPYAFADHHAFTARDFNSLNADIVLMTEKDAVKCQSFAQPNFWVLPVDAAIKDKDGLMAVILNKLRR